MMIMMLIMIAPPRHSIDGLNGKNHAITIKANDKIHQYFIQTSLCLVQQTVCV